MSMNRRACWRYLGLWGLALLAVAGGLWVRVKDFPAWRADPGRTHYDGRPVLSSYDGYYYLRQARDILESAYTPTDSLRLAPSGIERRAAPPLLSSLVAGVSRLTGVHWEWVAFFLPPLLAMSLILVLGPTARAFGGPAMAMFCAVVGVLAPGYVSRTGMGSLDTDGLVVAFTLLAALLPYGIVRAAGVRRYLYAGLLLANGALFFLWWDMAPQVVAAICAASLLPACLYAALRRRDALPFLAVPFLAGLLWLLAVRGFREVWGYFFGLLGNFAYVWKAADPVFPSLASSVLEQSPLSLFELATATVGHWALFAVAVFGLRQAFVRRPREFLLLLPVSLGIGCMAFKAARFSIFLSPALAIGLGAAIESMIQARPGNGFRKAWPAAGCLLAGLALAALYRANLAHAFRPAVNGSWIAGAARMGAQTPRNAVIWAWWDEGHAIAYWSRRATICDGGHVRDQIGTIAALPLATGDFRQAANWIHFYLARGLAGVRRVNEVAGGIPEGCALLLAAMEGGPGKLPKTLAAFGVPGDRDWATFFFPLPQERVPVYLLLDQQLAMTCGWWVRFGELTVPDLAARRGDFSVFDGVVRRGSQLACPPHLALDLRSGLFKTADGGTGRLSQAYVRERDQVRETTYQPEGPVFFHDARHAQGFMTGQVLAQSTFARLYLLGLGGESYFWPILDRGLLYQYWQVIGDLP